jgi:hypothetical protein
VIEAIPSSTGEPVTLAGLCSATGAVGELPIDSIRSILVVLGVYDAVEIICSLEDREVGVRARSERAWYFLKSLAQFIRKGLTLGINWDVEVSEGRAAFVGSSISGSELVRAMEQWRTEGCGDRTPLRRVSVSQAIIKAKIQGKREPRYLMQYDVLAGQYQFIGGRRKESDSEARCAMIRELEEELHENRFSCPKDYKLEELASRVEQTAISPTFGVLTVYDFAIFHAVFRCQQLRLGPDDKWITLSELKAGRTRSGRRVQSNLVSELEALPPNGLEGVPLSLECPQPPHG